MRGGEKKKGKKSGNCRSVIFMLSIGRVSQAQGSHRRIQAQASIHLLGLIEKQLRAEFEIRYCFQIWVLKFSDPGPSTKKAHPRKIQVYTEKDARRRGSKNLNRRRTIRFGSRFLNTTVVIEQRGYEQLTNCLLNLQVESVKLSTLENKQQNSLCRGAKTQSANALFI